MASLESTAGASWARSMVAAFSHASRAARVAAEAKAAQAEAEREREAAAVKAAAGGNREEPPGVMSPEEIKAWAARVAAEARGEK